MLVGGIFLALAVIQLGSNQILWGGWNPNSSRDRAFFMAMMTGAALTVPPLAAMLLLLGLLVSSKPIWIFTAGTLIVNTALLGLLTGIPSADFGPLSWSNQGAWLGVVGAARISAILIWNGVAMQVGHAWFLEALRLPPKATAYVGAIWLAMTGLKEDASNIQILHKINGTWPRKKLAQVNLAVALIPTLLHRSHERANARRDALFLAGISTPSWFAPFVAITALAAAGRLAFIAIPNVALTYVFIFIAGLLYGPLLAVAAAIAAMIGTNLLLSGLAPTAYVNVPAMALVGLIGGMMRGINFQTPQGKFLAAITGFIATLAFSVAADSLAWAIVPEFRGSVALLEIRVIAGLAFNLLPAIVNALLFAAVCGPTQRANGDQ